MYYSEHLSTCSLFPCSTQGKGQMLIFMCTGIVSHRGTPKFMRLRHFGLSFPTVAFTLECKQILSGWEQESSLPGVEVNGLGQISLGISLEQYTSYNLQGVCVK